MCGRFTVEDEIYEIRIAVSAQFEQLFRAWQPTFNIAPSAGPGHEQLIAVIAADGSRFLKLARWWFIPTGWNKPLSQLPTSFNARAEDIAKKPLWRGAFASSRCLIPANGWREFKGPRGHKQPYHFHLGNKLFAFAGLWTTWQPPDGQAVDSFAIITTEANDVVKPIHDRMPLVVPAERYADWLSPLLNPSVVLEQTRHDAQSLSLDFYASDPVANDVHYEGPKATRRIELVESRPAPVQQVLFGDTYELPQQSSPRRRGPV
jgi:putative SOS response-associated peptidase YedK